MGLSRRKKARTKNEMLTAQVSCSKLDLRLTGSESILKWPGSQEAAQPGPRTQEAENTCEVLQHKGLALPNPGAGLTAQASLPRGSSSPPRSTQGDVEVRRGGSPSPGASAGSAAPLIRAWDHPLPLLLTQHHPSVETPRHRRLMETFPTPPLFTTRGELSSTPSSCAGTCPGAGVTVTTPFHR